MKLVLTSCSHHHFGPIVGVHKIPHSRNLSRLKKPFILSAAVLAISYRLSATVPVYSVEAAIVNRSQSQGQGAQGTLLQCAHSTQLA